MREFDYLGSRQDWWLILEALPGLDDLVLIPDLWYPEAVPQMFRQVDDELKSLLEERRQVFIWSESFGSSLPWRRAAEGERKGQFHIIPGLGVPIIALALSPCYEENGTVNLNVGSLITSRKVIDLTTHQEMPAIAMNRLYDAILARVKRVLRRHRLPSGWIWIGPDALQLLSEGRAQIVAKGLL